mgnify:CR=1 FL=1
MSAYRKMLDGMTDRGSILLLVDEKEGLDNAVMIVDDVREEVHDYNFDAVLMDIFQREDIWWLEADEELITYIETDMEWYEDMVGEGKMMLVMAMLKGEE